MLTRTIQKCLSRLPVFIRKLNIRKKFLLLYVFAVVTPLIIVGVLAEQFMFSSLKNDYSVSVNEAVDQIVKNIEFRKLTYELLVTRTATDGELAARIYSDYSSFYPQWETVNYIDRSFGTVREYLPGIAVFRIYHTNSTLVEDGGILWKPDGRMLAGVNENEWYTGMLSSASIMKWGLANKNASGSVDLTLSRKINWVYGGSTIGEVFLQVHSDQVFDNLITGTFYQQGDILLLDKNGMVFSSSNKDLVGKNISDTFAHDIRMDELNKNYLMELDNKKCLMVVKPVSSDWIIMAAVPLDSLERKTQMLSIQVIGITLLLILLSAILILAVMNNIVKRLRSLEHKMTSVTQGKFDVSVQKSHSDELGDLEERFNTMAGRLGQLTEEIAVARSKEREEALNALQAQINPHFLYNTLGIIRWRALDSGNSDLCSLVDAITVFYRLSLNKGSSVITIQEELEHAKAYIQIQQFRYGNNIHVGWDIDESVLGLYTIKLILQPIVENCYMHGMVTKKKDGSLEIKVNRIADDVIFTVSDNGAGFLEEDLRQVFEGSRKSFSHGYGLKNIQERLKLYFGNRGMLKIISKQGEGVTVTIVIPACDRPPDIMEVTDNAESLDR